MTSGVQYTVKPPVDRLLVSETRTLWHRTGFVFVRGARHHRYAPRSAALENRGTSQ